MDWEAFYRSFREPDFVPGYQIQERLGGGAFGEVYKARKQSIGKAYAIKFLRLDDEVQREAIERELEQVRHFASIDHPNLVTIEDMGIVMGIPYLVMGYAGEQTLARRLRRGDLSRQDALRYFVQTCRGVLALHDRRLVHLDLKPSNIFLKGDVARVGDYGLAKLVGEGSLTLSVSRGTPHYMAPEILRNRAEPRSDIYSLGVILYECLAGKVPFDAPTPGGIVLRSDDAPPEFPPDFPPEWRAVCERCLRLEPADRYPGVDALLADLGQTARPGDSIVLDSRGEPPAARGEAPDDGPATPTRERVRAATARAKRAAVELQDRAAELAREAAEAARGFRDGLGDPLAPRGEARGDRRAPAPGTIPVPPPAGRGLFGALGSALVLAVEVPVTLLRAVGSILARGAARGVGGLGRRGTRLGRRILGFLLFVGGMALLGAFVTSVLALLLGREAG